MMHNNSELKIPQWFRLFACGTPLVALLTATIGVAFGTSVSPVVFAGLTALCWRIITKVLGIDSVPLVINLPQRFADKGELKRAS